jgi:hypothetical protein
VPGVVADEDHAEPPAQPLLTTGPVANGTFDVTDPSDPNFGWTTVGGAAIASGRAVLTESPSHRSSFTQTVTLPAGATSLSFTVLGLTLGASPLTLADAFEVSVLHGSTRVPLFGSVVGLSDTDAILSVHPDGSVFRGSAVTFAGAGAPGAVVSFATPVTFTLNLSGLSIDTPVELSFDLFGFGPADSFVSIDDVQVSTAPTTLTVTLDPASDSGAAGDNLTNLTLVSLVGTASPLAQVFLDTDGDGFDDGSVTATHAGTYRFDNVALAQGVNTLRVSTDAGGPAAATLGVTLDNVAPGLRLPAVINGGLTQRSAVRTVLLPLSEGIVPSGQWLRLHRPGVGDVPLNAAWISFDPLTHAATLDLSMLDLPDGRYRLDILPDGAHDAAGNALDVDGDGTPDAGTGRFASVEFFKLAGDADADTVVTAKDLLLVRRSKGLAPGQPGHNPNADLDGDGAVGDADIAIVAANLAHRLDPVGPARAAVVESSGTPNDGRVSVPTVVGANVDVTFRNDGASPLMLSGITLAGAHASAYGFEVLGAPSGTTAYSVAPGLSVVIRLTFLGDATRAGDHAAQLILAHNDPTLAGSLAIQVTTAGTPAVTARLEHDTGYAADGVTSQAAVIGTFTSTAPVSTLTAWLDAGAPVQFQAADVLTGAAAFRLVPARLALLAGSTLADGPHTLHLAATDAAGVTSATTSLPFTLDTTAPEFIAPAVVNAGMTQRSHIASVAFTFSEPVAETLTPASFLLATPTGDLVSLSGATVSYNARTVTLDLSLVPLPDGDYTLTVLPGTVTDVAGNALSTSPIAATFHKLAGDVDGDRTVTAVDLLIVQRAANTAAGQPGYNPDADVVPDDAVTPADVKLVVDNLSRTLDTPPGDRTPPTFVVPAVINDGLTQRSQIHRLAVRFSEPLRPTGPSVADLRLTSLASGTDVDLTGAVVTAEGSTVTVSLSTVPLDDGEYTLYLGTANVADLAGNVTADPAGISVNFHKLTGDVDGDRTVTAVDLLLAQRTLNATPAEARFDPDCDLDGSGATDAADVALVVNNLGHTLLASPPTTANADALSDAVPSPQTTATPNISVAVPVQPAAVFTTTSAATARPARAGRAMKLGTIGTGATVVMQPRLPQRPTTPFSTRSIPSDGFMAARLPAPAARPTSAVLSAFAGRKSAIHGPKVGPDVVDPLET